METQEVEIGGFADLDEAGKLAVAPEKIKQALANIALGMSDNSNIEQAKSIRENITKFILTTQTEGVNVLEPSYMISPFTGKVRAQFILENEGIKLLFHKEFQIQKQSDGDALYNKYLNIYSRIHDAKSKDAKIVSLKDKLLAFINKADKTAEEVEIAKDKVATYFYVLGKYEEFKQLASYNTPMYKDEAQKVRDFNNEKTVLSLIFPELKGNLLILNWLNQSETSDQSFKVEALKTFLEGFFEDLLTKYYYGNTVEGKVQEEFGPYGLWYISMPSYLARNLANRSGSFSNELLTKGAKVINYFVSDFTKYSPLPQSKMTYGLKNVDNPSHVAELIIAKMFALMHDQSTEETFVFYKEIVAAYHNLIDAGKFAKDQFDKNFTNNIRNIYKLIQFNQEFYTNYNDLAFAVSELGDKYVTYGNALYETYLGSNDVYTAVKFLKAAETLAGLNTFSSYFDEQILHRQDRVNNLSLNPEEFGTDIDAYVAKFNKTFNEKSFYNEAKFTEYYVTKKLVTNGETFVNKYEDYQISVAKGEGNNLVVTLKIKDRTNDLSPVIEFTKTQAWVKQQVSEFPAHEVHHGYESAESKANVLPSSVTTESLNLSATNGVTVADVVLVPNDLEGKLVVNYKERYEQLEEAKSLTIEGFLTTQAKLNSIINNEATTVTLEEGYNRSEHLSSEVQKDNLTLKLSDDTYGNSDLTLTANVDEAKLTVTIKLSKDGVEATKDVEFDGFKTPSQEDAAKLQVALDSANVTLTDETSKSTKLASSVTESDLTVTYTDSENAITKELSFNADDKTGTLTVTLKLTYKGQEKAKEFPFNDFLKTQAKLDAIINSAKTKVELNSTYQKAEHFANEVQEADLVVTLSENGFGSTSLELTPNQQEGKLSVKLTLTKDDLSASKTIEISGFKTEDFAKKLKEAIDSASVTLTSEEGKSDKLASEVTDGELTVTYTHSDDNNITKTLTLEPNDVAGSLKVTLKLALKGQEQSKEVTITGFQTTEQRMDADSNKVALASSDSTTGIENIELIKPDEVAKLTLTAPQGYSISGQTITVKSIYSSTVNYSFKLTKGTVEKCYSFENVKVNDLGLDTMREKLVDQILVNTAKKAVAKTYGAANETDKKVVQKLFELKEKTNPNEEETKVIANPVALMVYAVAEAKSDNTGLTEAKKLLDIPRNEDSARNKEALEIIRKVASQYNKLANLLVNGDQNIQAEKLKEFMNTFMDKFFTDYYYAPNGDDIQNDASASGEYAVWMTQIPNDFSESFVYGLKLYKPNVVEKFAKTINYYIPNIAFYNKTPNGQFAWNSGKFINDPKHMRNIVLPKLIALTFTKESDKIKESFDNLGLLIEELIKSDKWFTDSTIDTQSSTYNPVDFIRLLTNFIHVDSKVEDKYIEGLNKLLQHVATLVADGKLFSKDNLKANTDKAQKSIEVLSLLLIAENQTKDKTLGNAMKEYLKDTQASEFAKLSSVLGWLQNKFKTILTNNGN
ncbi:lipoprotein 17-related variable surface protein [Mycoplasmopsis gallinacea]|uniref:Putative lipoprotein n=1 Tax=Mycoplasmopsis gallinacea TaxID=29556 RepID=A0A449A2D7_9BACT|nr:lipoprotein 17-related variable surface protein [Mycoplasmopsis gallinacea]VEU58430.1 putative lipoprotein [Mycoplasmopsis gallinacea]